ncbi:phenylalanine--tRNA ligase subunit beta [Brachybacterium huguangmaarense]|uniref:Phenylalanine--tRNA ligase beta subunit n=1 Tax=Brachybacterium huguangmaarense TaxID=1652028 RepID=A0ABY6FYV4_9MICO|nr:phenylalanine--tRNA ligase subunit beta [Brachybacterium huguangmaarense]UYG15598.1 phenylalanine--tRNA ligase subunit beta [Brachybacterium huguangmaarense]
MPRIPLTWLGDHVELPEDVTAESVAAALVSVGLEEEGIIPAQVTGPLVVGRVLDLVKEPQKNGKTINWCRVDVGPEHNEDLDDPKDPQPGDERPSRGIICGAHNFEPGDLVIVSLPGTVLPGPFPIAARKTYGHLSDGMICSAAELGLGDGAGDEAAGILVVGRGSLAGVRAEPGDDAIALLGLGDEVVEINVTPDRGYAFSLRGVAREYSHATGRPFTDPAGEVTPAQGGRGGLPVQLRDEAPIRGHLGCTRFVAVEVRGIDPAAPTPRWMRQRLTQAGMRPLSLVVDVTNYVMLDLGQPLHAYDSHRLVGPITVRRAQAGERLETLDDKPRDLDPEDLVIADFGGEGGTDRAIGIAGVMGGASTEVSSETVNVILEAATFDPVTVARSARRHRLPSEASKRFERGVDPLLPPVAAQRAAELIVRYGGGQIDPRVTDERVDGAPAPRETIELPLGDAERLVGVAYTPEQVRGSLEMIGCVVEGEDPLRVTPPSWRGDLTIREDLIEEIARLVGYDTIPSVLPQAPGGRGLTRLQRGRRSARTALAEDGLVEVTSYPFVSASVFDELGLPADDDRRRAVRLANPIAEDEPLLRTDLLETLLPTARRNLGRGEESIAIFQLAPAFLARPGAPVAPLPGVEGLPAPAELAAIDDALPLQPTQAAAVVAGPRSPASWWGAEGDWGWADALDLAHRTAAAVGAEIQPAAVERAPFHPGRGAELRGAEGTVLGYAGELHPRVVTAFGLPARGAAMVLDVDALIASAPDVVRAEPVSTYPVAKEDFAFVVGETVPAIAVEAALAAGIGDVLESVRLFDVYTGEQLGAGMKSLAFAVRLRSATGTLSAEEIRAARDRAIAAVDAAVGGVLRA